MTEDRKQINYSRLVAQEENGNYVVLDYVFYDTLWDKEFRGAVGSTFSIVTKAQYDYHMDPEVIAESLQGLDLELSIDESLLDKAHEILQYDGESWVFDQSYYEYHDEILELARKEFHKEYDEEGAYDDPEEWPEYPVLVECVGGGRCFGGSYHDKYVKVFSMEGVKAAAAAERIDYRKLLNV